MCIDNWPGPHVLRGVNLQKTQGLANCPVVSATMDVAGVFEEMASLKDQVWVSGTLDSKSRLVSWNVMGEGARPLIRPIDAFSSAIINSGMGVFLVRNSPRGITSQRAKNFDRALLGTLLSTGAALGYAFLDYVVMEKSHCRSVLFNEVYLSKAFRRHSIVRASLSRRRGRFSLSSNSRFEALR